MKQIKYFAVNEEIENQIKSIRRAIYLSMNGICAENIDNSGLEYKQNFGVAWSRLCEIAQNYTPYYDLAERLWLMSIRETKLLATLLCPPQELTAERLAEWSQGITTIELAEIFAFALLRKTTHLTTEILALEQSENPLLRLTAYHALARQVAQNFLVRNEQSKESSPKLGEVHEVGRGMSQLSTLNSQLSTLQKAIERINPEDLSEISAFRAIESLLSAIQFRTSDLNHIIYNKFEEIKSHPTTYSNQLIINLEQ